MYMQESLLNAGSWFRADHRKEKMQEKRKVQSSSTCQSHHGTANRAKCKSGSPSSSPKFDFS